MRKASWMTPNIFYFSHNLSVCIVLLRQGRTEGGTGLKKWGGIQEFLFENVILSS